jgi:hypothetical protein
MGTLIVNVGGRLSYCPRTHASKRTWNLALRSVVAFQMLFSCESLPSVRIGYRASAWCGIANLTRSKDAYPCRQVVKVTLHADSLECAVTMCRLAGGSDLEASSDPFSTRRGSGSSAATSDQQAMTQRGFHVMQHTKAHSLPLQTEHLAGSKTKGTSREMSCSKLTT